MVGRTSSESSRLESNQRPPAYKAGTATTELREEMIDRGICRRCRVSSVPPFLRESIVLTHLPQPGDSIRSDRRLRLAQLFHSHDMEQRYQVRLRGHAAAGLGFGPDIHFALTDQHHL